MGLIDPERYYEFDIPPHRKAKLEKLDLSFLEPDCDGEEARNYLTEEELYRLGRSLIPPSLRDEGTEE